MALIRFGLVFILVSFLVSCGSNKLMTGRQSFERQDFFQSAQIFREVYSKLKDREEKAEAVYLLGESYYQLGDYAKASPWLKNALRFNYPNDQLDLDFADALRASGKTDESRVVYQTILDSSPNNLRAINGLKGLALYDSLVEYPGFYQVESMKALNSEGNDISSFIDSESGQLVYSSSGNETRGKKVSSVDGFRLADIYFANYDSASNQWNSSSGFDDEYGMNSDESETHFALSPDGGFVVVERAVVRPGSPLKSRLYFSKKEGETWPDIQLLPFSSDGSNYRQACWTADGKALVFSSDRTGSLGGFDLWQVAVDEAGKTSDPKNMGPEINTPGNEIYPFMRSNGLLYFSSNYHPGIGGQDIFCAEKSKDGRWNIEHMGMPINSLQDDLGIVFSGQGDQGVFASSRKGSRAIDLYRFILPPHLFMCFGKVHNDETDSIIPNVNVRVVGTDGSSSRLVTKNGEFELGLNPGVEYTLIAYKKGFLNAQVKLSTKGLTEAKDFHVQFQQTPTDKPIALDNILYETGNWNLLPASRNSLDRLIEILAINPEIRIEISAHTDEVGDDDFNLSLSQKRADEVVEYLTGKGISASRLVAKGYGENRPLVVTPKISKQVQFLKNGTRLTESFLLTLKPDQREIAKSLNRRTEFEVIGQ